MAAIPVGYLVDAVTGTEHPITGITVLGPDPGGDPAVTGGGATMITVEDPDIDEVHVRIRISGSSVTVESAGATGCWIQHVGGPTTPLDTTAQPLDDGAQLWLGSRSFAFRSTGAGAAT